MKLLRDEEDLDGQTGRWNRKEHQAFLEGLKMFGKNWKLVAGHIGTRNSTQVRSHAQKYFLREASKHAIKQRAEEYYGQVNMIQVKSEKVDAFTQYGEGMTFLSYIETN